MTSDLADIVTFVVHEPEPARAAAARHALFELCCRTGVCLRFAVAGDPLASASRVVHVVLDPARGDVVAAEGAAVWRSTTVTAPGATPFGLALGGASGDPADLVAGAMELLSLGHAAGVARDRYGRVPQASTKLADFVCVPLLENAAAALRAALKRHWPGLATLPMPWGDGKVVVAVTHDVDGPLLHSAFAMTRSAVLALTGRAYEREALEIGWLTRRFGRPDPYWAFEDWVRLNRAAFGAASTFYFYPGRVGSARRHRVDPHYTFNAAGFALTLRRLRDAGCEVGVHFGIHARGAADYAAAVGRVAEVAGAPIAGARTHYWTGVWDDPYAAWSAMQQAGLAYDASLNPLELGFRAGLANPILPSYRHDPTLDRPFVALPTAVMDGYSHPRFVPVSKAELSLRLGQVVDAVLAHGFVCLDWHERAFSNVGPWKGFMGPYFAFLATLRERADVEFVTAEQAARRWATHSRACLAPAGSAS